MPAGRRGAPNFRGRAEPPRGLSRPAFWLWAEVRLAELLQSYCATALRVGQAAAKQQCTEMSMPKPETI
jgi:hypothetical protein